MHQTEIRIENARSHNLKGVSCRIPIGALTVVTGVSGSGKSTLAFDTLYAEGQRRYVTSLSTYARQFLERLPRPDVDRISSLPPAIAIERRNRVTNARSTVGTATEIIDHLRLLYARVGQIRCPDCGELAARGHVGDVADRVASRFAGERIQICARAVPEPGESPDRLRERLVRDGFTRLLAPDGRVIDWSDRVAGEEAAQPPNASAARDAAMLLIDRLAIPEAGADVDSDARARLGEAIAQAFGRGDGQLFVATAAGERVRYRTGLACDGCGRVFAEPEPARLSWNSPLGACPDCQGFGRTAEVDWDRVVPDPGLSLEDHAVAPFTTAMGRSMQRDLLQACRATGLPTDVPWASLSEAQRAFVLQGDDEAWYGVQALFDWLEGRRFKVQARVLIARYRRFVPCLACDGTRLTRAARSVEIAGRDLGSLSRENVSTLRAWLEDALPTPADRARAGRLLDMLRTRVATVSAVGLGYMGLDRPMRTLSGGEAQRIQLATALGGGLTASLYVLDEPTVGLHPRDLEQLIEVLLAIRDQGNTVVVVEHAAEVLAVADHVIDLGPGAGRHGGHLVVEGDLETVRSTEESQTGRLLRGEIGVGAPAARGPARHVLGVRGARGNNLHGLDVDIPLERLVVVTGVSGAGKSTLIRSVIAERLAPGSGAGDAPAECERIEGAERVRELVVLDQTPAVRSPRSNPATVSKAFDRIRSRFAATREARALGVGPGWFSFNVAGGRCDACEGSGEVVIDMQFLDDVRVPCDDCDGRRYKREVLAVRLDGRSIVDVLALTIDEAVVVFAEDRQIVSRLEPFQRVGLGYLTLGQPLSTLSGGENQRVRLGLALADPGPGKLYILDEPTTGLHAADVEVLLGCLDALIEAGGSAWVIEHHLDVIRRADWVIDLGPEAGPGGGQLVAAGPPQALARVPESYTGQALTGS